MYVPLRTAAKHYNVNKQTIAAWAERGDIEYIELPSGHRRFKIRGDGNVVDAPKGEKKEKLKVCYCRVSSHGQKEDLERQIEYMRSKYEGWLVYSDIGSGLNWKRQSLKTLLRQCLQGDISHVCVAHKDRLARFGYEIIEYIMGQCGVKLLCDHEDAHTSKEQELVDDILSIVTVFSARIHGQRHYQKNQKGRPRAAKRPRDEAEAVDGLLSADVQPDSRIRQGGEGAQ